MAFLESPFEADAATGSIAIIVTSAKYEFPPSKKQYKYYFAQF
jgi:hypothetical protein